MTRPEDIPNPSARQPAKLNPGRCDVCNGSPRLMLSFRKTYDYSTGRWSTSPKKRAIRCDSCPRPYKWHETEDEAIAAWNRRAGEGA